MRAECDEPCDACQELHKPLLAEIIVSERDAKPGKGSLQKQCFQRIAAYRAQLLLTLFAVFEGNSVQKDLQQRDEEKIILAKMLPKVSGRLIAGLYDAKAGSDDM